MPPGNGIRSGIAVSNLENELTIVLLLHNCGPWLQQTLDHLTALKVDIVAVDNASSDDTRDVVRRNSGITLVELNENTGAAGRNVGAKHAATPYVAFCDDDGWYELRGLRCAVEIFERFPQIGLVNARIVVGPDDDPVPISIEMASSPLTDASPMPGTKLLSFMGGAAIVRRSAYLAVGGYDPRFFIGGEEETLGWPMAAAGWSMRYVPEVVMHHHPSLANYTRIRHYGIRNTLWNAWLHRPVRSALRYSAFIVLSAPKNRDLWRGLAMCLRGMPRVLRERKPVSAELDDELRTLEERRFRAWRLTALRAPVRR